MDPEREKKKQLETEMDNIMNQFPEYCVLYDEDPLYSNKYQYACFMCIQLYIRYHALFIPIMIPNGWFVLQNETHVFAHTYDKQHCEKSTRMWEPIKFTPLDIMNKQITGNITFSRY